MTRVVARATSAHAVRARSRLSKPRIRKHKIIMESITQEKKKLRSVISFEAKAPPGYTFIPAGNPQFTNACKEICRKDGLQVFAVSTTPHQRMHDLSQQVHRIGYHFPSVVVATICMERGLFLSSTGKVVPYHASTQNPAGIRGQERRADSEVSQNTINVEARDAIKDLFPNIPTKDLNRIIKTAFQKGKRKVGTAVELPLARRVQLAVVAHIRHLYTDYDRLLKVTSFQDARAAVEEPCLAKLVQWRGDDENGKTVLEDVFREVIVISDDEDDDDDDESDLTEEGFARDDRNSSVEVVSSNALAGEIQTRPVNFGNIPAAEREAAQDFSEDEAPTGFRFIPQPHRKKKTTNKKRPDRRGFSRYQAWDRARDRYRDGGYLPNMARADERVAQRYSLPPATHDPLIETSRINIDHPRPVAHESTAGVPYLMRPFDPNNEARFHRPLNTFDRPSLGNRPLLLEAHKTRPVPPDRIQLADGAIFERADNITFPECERIVPQSPDLSPVFISSNGPPARPEERMYRMPIGGLHSPSHRRADISEYQEHRDRVLPSIEGPEPPSQCKNQAVDHPDLRRRVPDEFQHYHMKPTKTHIEEVSGRMNIININENRPIFPQKRQRVERNTIRDVSPMVRSRDGNHLSLQQGQYNLSNYRNQGPLEVSCSYAEQQFFPSDERPEGPARHPERISIGTKRLFDNIPHSAHFPSVLSDRPEHGRRYGVPPLHEHRHGTSSQKLLEYPHFMSKSTESGYMVRSNDRLVRPDRLSNFDRRQPHLADHEDFVDPRGPSLVVNDSRRPYVVLQDLPPVRRKFPPDENGRVSNNNKSHDFVRRVNLQDVNESSRQQEPQRRIKDPVSPRHNRYLSARAKLGAFKAYDRVRAETQADRPYSPHQTFPSQAPLSGPRSTFYIGPDSPTRSDRPTLNLPESSSAAFHHPPRNVRVPIDDERYRNDEIQYHTVIRGASIRRRPEGRPIYYERIPPERPSIVPGD
ncbi:hypothetical protein GX48_04200 [Paracoccidioides brasiliensis]|nr:hypothetical protein GX48_04200 [Paracoccidioides brasiliensis]